MKKGIKVVDSGLRSTERVSLDQNVNEYFTNEVLPHIDKDAWLDLTKTKIGYEINFQQYFYEYKNLEASTSIAERINTRQQEIMSIVSSIFND